MRRVRLSEAKRQRVRLDAEQDYWTLLGVNVVFIAPQDYNPLNKSCVRIDESKYNFFISKGYRSLRLIRGDKAEPACNWWLAPKED